MIEAGRPYQAPGPNIEGTAQPMCALPCYAPSDMDRATAILVIEDDPAVAEGLVEGIGREGFDVHWEATGTTGVAYARDESPQLIVLDVRLPDGSGHDFCRQMRQFGLRMPILMLTVESDEVDKVLGLEMGADDYLTKPYRLRELIARIRALLRRTYGELSAAEADVLYVDDLVIDRTSARVTRGGQALNLTPTEFRLLVFMAQHPGQAFSRTQLIENVWGSEGELYDDKTVSVHVRRLREKIEPDPSEPEIVLTVPGIGYRLAR
jgi:DNA-binding response OmpR family regulator